MVAVKRILLGFVIAAAVGRAALLAGSAITFATDVTERGTGVGLLTLSDGTTCTGTLLTNLWVVTARHCVFLGSNGFQMGTVPAPPGGMTVVMDGTMKNAAELIPYELGADLAIVRLDAPMPVNGATDAFDMNFFALSWARLCSLRDDFDPTRFAPCVPYSGVMVRCRGFGDNERSTASVLREAMLPVVALGRGMILVGVNSNRALPQSGDSGSTCTASFPPNNPQIIGAMSSANPTDMNFDPAGSAEYDGGDSDGRSWAATSRVGYELLANQSRKCLDVRGISQADHAVVQQYPCNSGLNQRWRIIPAGHVSGKMTFNIRAAHSSKCLEENGSHRIVQEPCGATANSQRWFVRRVSTSNYEIKSAANPSRCADIIGAVTDDGAELQTYPCNGNPNQRFTVIVHVPEGSLEVSFPSGMCWDVPGFADSNGTNVQQYSCNGGTNQEFRFEEVADRLHRIHPKHAAGKCLVLHGGTGSGARLQLSDCDGTPAQLFRFDFRPSYDGIGYQIWNQETRRCLEGHNQLAVVRPLQQSACGDHDYQVWWLRQ